MYLRKADLILAACVIAVCAALSVYVYGLGSHGSEVIVRYQGEVYGTWPLKEDRVVDIDTKDGHNQITISHGKVLMTEADCPDGYCRNQHRSTGGIDQSNQTIVCLPNRIVVTVESGSTDDGQNHVDSDAPDVMTGSPSSRTVLDDESTEE